MFEGAVVGTQHIVMRIRLILAIAQSIWDDLAIKFQPVPRDMPRVTLTILVERLYRRGYSNFRFLVEPMLPRLEFLKQSKRNQLPKILSGSGIVLLLGSRPLKVRYEINFEERRGSVVFSGTIRGNKLALEKLWLAPVVCLRLENGGRLDMSITNLKGCVGFIEQVYNA
ncbi:hypothetical protein [Methylobacterium sp. Leaf125]|uniref:hypothetical protein n=1 Tax=Methylobacterium sp. Leaf125 TaxID=1736265 RepID=UPI000A5F7E39|nr:hypothetical protein [Methylobacterium sp. Leaf125]